MKLLSRTFALVLISMFAPAVFAQPPAPGEATKEHEFLRKFVGEWEAVAEASGGEGQPPQKVTAVMKCSMLGNFWLVNKSEMDVSEMSASSIQTIGYDPSKKKYVGTWIDSMMNHMWHYEGTVDSSGKKITLAAEGPSMVGEGTSKYRDAYEFVDADTFIATSSVLGEDGKWTVLMKSTGKRRK